MRNGTILATVSAMALAAGGYYYLSRAGGVTGPPVMQPDGTATDDGIIVKKTTVDYETIIKEALEDKASFLTLTVARDSVRDRHLETVVKHTPLPSSRARVRVKYHVEYPIGYVLGPGQFLVTGNERKLVLTLHRPQLIARPSVKLLSYKILDSGFLIDEKTAVIKLQQRIQPEAEKRARAILRRPYVTQRSERALRAFLKPIMAKQAGGAAPPQIEFRYR